LVVHLDAMDVDGDGELGNNPMDGASVTNWNDKSGNNQNFWLHPVGDYEPKMAIDGLNGQPSIEITSKVFRNDALALPADKTIYFVFQYMSRNNNEARLIMNSLDIGGGRENYVVQNLSGSSGFYFRKQGGGWIYHNDYMAQGDGIGLNEPTILGLHVSSSDASTINYNGEIFRTLSPVGMPNAWGSGSTFIGSDGKVSRVSQISASELLIFNRKLNEAEQALVLSYLNAKWGLNGDGGARIFTELSDGTTIDKFPTNNAAWKDSDDDGYPDQWGNGATFAEDNTIPLSVQGLLIDKFPSDNAAYEDSDNDGSPDAFLEVDGALATQLVNGVTIDKFPDNAVAWKDSDDDGYPDQWAYGPTFAQDASNPVSNNGLMIDKFPLDDAAFLDDDNDGSPDAFLNVNGTLATALANGITLDQFLGNTVAWKDTDLDGYPDQWGNGPTFANDNTIPLTQGGLEIDKFPLDAAAYLDSDDDGSPDAFLLVNGAIPTQLANGITIDKFPLDRVAYLDSDDDGSPDSFLSIVNDAPPADITPVSASGYYVDGVLKTKDNYGTNDYLVLPSAGIDGVIEPLGSDVDFYSLTGFHAGAGLGLSGRLNNNGHRDIYAVYHLDATYELSQLKLWNWGWSNPGSRSLRTADISLSSDNGATWGDPIAMSFNIRTTDQPEIKALTGVANAVKIRFKTNGGDTWVGFDEIKFFGQPFVVTSLANGTGVDKFPDNDTVWKDSDDDGYPDQWGDGSSYAQDNTIPLTQNGFEIDKFPLDPAAYVDSDNDGSPDAFLSVGGVMQTALADGITVDKFPLDPAAYMDSDNDGYADAFLSVGGVVQTELSNGRTIDVYLNDGSAALDSDLDGYPDELFDSNGDGIIELQTTNGKVIDALPFDARDHLDADSDGMGDTSDAYPNDSLKYLPDVIVTTPTEGFAYSPEPAEFMNDDIRVTSRVIDFEADQILSQRQLAMNLKWMYRLEQADGTILVNDTVMTNGDGFSKDLAVGVYYVVHLKLLNSDGSAFTTTDLDGNSLEITSIRNFRVQSYDRDEDGVDDASDVYPDDPSAAADTDGDGYPDEMFDADGDGVLEAQTLDGFHVDAFPTDATEWLDFDTDGRGDNTDPFIPTPISFKVLDYIENNLGLASLDERVSVWFDAANINGNNNVGMVSGDTLGEWKDLSSNDHHATQTRAMSRPSYQLNQLNAQPVVRFENHHFNIGYLDSELTSYTMFVVYQVKSAQAMNGGSLGYKNPMIMSHQKTSEAMSNDWSVGLSAVDGYTTHRIRPAAMLEVTLPQVGMENTVMGNVASTLNQPLFGDISELIIIKGQLTDQQKASIRYYLSNKWQFMTTMDSDGDGIIDTRDVAPNDPTRTYKLPELPIVIDDQLGVTSNLSAVADQLKLWLDANNTNYLTNLGIETKSLLTEWKDLSGNDHHAIAPDLASPMYVKEDNGQSYVYFSNDQMGIPTGLGIETNQPRTLIMLLKNTRTKEMNAVFGTNLDNHININNGDKYRRIEINNTNMRDTGNQSYKNGSDHILTVASNGSETTVRLNNRVIDKNLVNQFDFDLSTPVGIGHYFYGDNGFIGKFHEIMVFSDTLSNQELTIIHRYLADKWGIEDVVDSDQDGIVDSIDPDADGDNQLDVDPVDPNDLDGDGIINDNDAFPNDATKTKAIITSMVLADGQTQVLQIEGAKPINTDGGVATNDKRSLYINVNDTTTVPSYSGTQWPHAMLHALPNLGVGIGITHAIENGVYTINGRPVYLFSGDPTSNDSTGAMGDWRRVGISGDGIWEDPDNDGKDSSSGTGEGLGVDKFPDDPAASVDSDEDGYPDEWNPGMSELNSTTGLILDQDPTNSNISVEPTTIIPEFVPEKDDNGLVAMFTVSQESLQFKKGKVKRWTNLIQSSISFSQSNSDHMPSYDESDHSLVFSGNEFLTLNKEIPSNNTIIIVAKGQGELFGDSSTYLGVRYNSVYFGTGEDVNAQAISTTKANINDRVIYIIQNNMAEQTSSLKVGYTSLVSKANIANRKQKDATIHLGKAGQSIITNFQGKVHEMLIYNRVLTQTELTDIQNELALRWTVETAKAKEVFVDKAYTGKKVGTTIRPWAALKNAFRHVFKGGRVKVKKGEYKERMTVTENVVIEADDGNVIIGIPKSEQ
jgi:hypothetical protein